MIYDFETPRGRRAALECREGTNDYNLVNSILSTDEYGLADRHLVGWAIDVGAHVGAVSVALALDNPGLRVVAVEPVPENTYRLRENVALNGLGRRVLVDERAATAPGVREVLVSCGYRAWGSHHPDYVSAHRYIGNQYRHEGDPEATRATRGVSLGGLMDGYWIDEISFLKVDCEGCEWDFLRDPRIDRVRTMIGELHAGAEGFDPCSEADPALHEAEWDPGCHRCREEFAHLEALLLPTHDVEIDVARELFEAVRRPM